jgi:hypothetical protein
VSAEESSARPGMQNYHKLVLGAVVLEQQLFQTQIWKTVSHEQLIAFEIRFNCLCILRNRFQYTQSLHVPSRAQALPLLDFDSSSSRHLLSAAIFLIQHLVTPSHSTSPGPNTDTSPWFLHPPYDKSCMLR